MDSKIEMVKMEAPQTEDEKPVIEWSYEFEDMSFDEALDTYINKRK